MSLMKRIRVVLLVAGVLVASTAGAQTASPFSAVAETAVLGGTEFKGLVSTEVSGKAVTKRFVLRVPAAANWNGSLVIGAHGGGGGFDYDRSGKVIGTDETALDDVIGRYSLGKGFAYGSVDRDGIGGPREGLALTYQFTEIARTEVGRRMKIGPARVYLVGLSAGGSVARLAAEDDLKIYAGTILIAGAAATCRRDSTRAPGWQRCGRSSTRAFTLA